jgi:hypothetical protein
LPFHIFISLPFYFFRHILRIHFADISHILPAEYFAIYFISDAAISHISQPPFSAYAIAAADRMPMLAFDCHYADAFASITLPLADIRLQLMIA